jgi:hypothetical protein
VGGALGVAAVGAVVSALYRDNLGDAAAGLPAAARSVAEESISGAYGVAENAGAAAPGLVQSANDAFLVAMHYAAVGTTAFTLLSALVALIWLPGRLPAAPAPTSPEAQADLALAEV